jgi:RNA polymerase sigma-70 factor (ECF subfamily)
MTLSPVPKHPAPELSDEEVARRVLGGEVALFELLMRRYNQRLFRIARAIVGDPGEAEDVLQEAWVRAFQHLVQFDGRARLSTWLAKIALHEALARRRRAGRFRPLDTGELSDESPEARLPSQDADPERRAAAAELGALLEEELARLSEAARAVFVLREVEGLSTAETAAALGIREEAVKVRLHRARGRLRQALDRRLDRAARELWGFQAERCDRQVARFLARIEGLETRSQ